MAEQQEKKELTPEQRASKRKNLLISLLVVLVIVGIVYLGAGIIHMLVGFALVALAVISGRYTG